MDQREDLADMVRLQVTEKKAALTEARGEFTPWGASPIVPSDEIPIL